MLTVKQIKEARDKLEWEEVKDIKSLAKIKTVDEMLPKPAENQTHNSSPHIWEEQYSILEECLRLDCTIEEACMTAWISVPSYYVHKRNNPDFALRMDRAREFPKMMARAAVIKRIRLWDANTALKYLTLRDKRYKAEPVLEEWEENTAPVVQFISVASNEWAENWTNHDSQSDIKQESAYDSSASSWERVTPWENEEEALRRLDSLSFSSE